MTSMLRIVTAAVLAVTGVALAEAASTGVADEAKLQLALDKPVNIVMDSAPVADVFRKITVATGVKFIIDPRTLDALPYGAHTQMRVTFENVTLREALNRMLSQRALRWRIDGQAVRILPSDALTRMCRRASYDEFEILGRMHSLKLQPATRVEKILAQLRKATGADDLRLPALDVELVERASKALPCTAAVWLDALCEPAGLTWYLWGEDIVIIDRKAQVKRQLQKHVTLRYKGADIVEVLRDLAGKADVALSMAPGVLKYLPAEARTNFNLVMADATVDQALEVISGATGLVFAHTAEGIRVEASEELTKPNGRGGRRRRSQFFIKMSLPGVDGATVEVFFRGSDLPEDIIEKILAEKKKLIEKLRVELLDEES